jgi:alkanesulfonate monooxygenase SsuD/methylene tetrahydromethanopterin reductase-like flavin-dependent oxidoreductase (luciferase family)
MRYGVYAPNFGTFADPHLLAELAREAERAGWDGFFLWDHILFDPPVPMADPWVALAAMAMTTERIKLGALVTPVPRRRPWKLAREAVTLDHLSRGRLILGAGIGGDWSREYTAFGESADDRLHGAMLDEGLAVLTGLWSGESFSYQGTHYHVRNARFLPTPVQTPRIPIWVGGYWPHKAPFRRAARWDGVYPLFDGVLSPARIREIVAYVQSQRTTDAPFDLVLGDLAFAETPPDSDLLAEYAAAGVTWWFHCFMGGITPAAARARLRQGPPGRE